MKKIKISNKKIDELGINDTLVDILKGKEINTLYDLWDLSRTELKRKGLNNEQINTIIIHLQLLGLDLNHKQY